MSTEQENDNGLGNPYPDNSSLDYHQLSPQECDYYRRLDEEKEKQQLEKLVEQLGSTNSGISLPGLPESFIFPKGFNRTFNWIALALSAVLLLFVLGQVTSFMAQYNAMPTWSKTIIGSLFFLIACVIFYLIFRLWQLCRSLKKNNKINLEAVNILKERKELQTLVKDKEDEAVAKLKDYLKKYDFQSISRKADLEKAGLSTKTYESFKTAEQELLNKTDEWIEYFQENILSKLNDVAKMRVRGYSLRTAAKTAISPLPLLDSAIVLTMNLLMIKDLMIIYNLRASNGGATNLLLRCVGHVYIAGEMQGLNETVADTFFQDFDGQLAQFGAGLLKKAGSKIGEGAANGFMTYRLGLAAIKLLEPCSVSEK